MRTNKTFPYQVGDYHIRPTKVPSMSIKGQKCKDKQQEDRVQNSNYDLQTTI